MAYYMDTSALVKLVSREPESTELLQWATSVESPLVTCDLARTELMRAVRRLDPGLAVAARTVLDSLTILKLSTSLFESAIRIEPVEVRSLDALHLAAALALGDELEAIVVYDKRLADAAVRYGIAVVSPGAASVE